MSIITLRIIDSDTGTDTSDKLITDELESKSGNGIIINTDLHFNSNNIMGLQNIGTSLINIGDGIIHKSETNNDLLYTVNGDEYVLNNSLLSSTPIDVTLHDFPSITLQLLSSATLPYTVYNTSIFVEQGRYLLLYKLYVDSNLTDISSLFLNVLLDSEEISNFSRNISSNLTILDWKIIDIPDTSPKEIILNVSSSVSNIYTFSGLSINLIKF